MNKNIPESKNFYRLSKADVILVAVILAVSAFQVVEARFIRGGISKRGEVYINNELSADVDLGEDRIIYFLGGDVSIEVKGNRLKVLDSNCLRHICMKRGWISAPGETIACVPNKMLIVIGRSRDSLVDAVVY